MSTAKELNCPTCKKNIIWSEKYPYRPFCSHRCQLIDLGEWVSEGYSIPEETPQGGELNQNKQEWE